MTQRRRFQSIVLLTTVVFSAMFLWALAVVVWPVPAVYADEPPDAVDDLANTDEDTPVAIGVLANDTDPDPGDTLTVTVVSTPANGIANTNGITATYTPTLNFNGLDVFTYTVRDTDNLTDTATVTVTVQTVNDSPVVSDIPSQTIAEGETFTVINLDDYVNDVDNPDDEMTWAYSGNSDLPVSIINRVATIGIPDPDWNGSETIVFTATDPGLLSDSDGATFTVTPVNDPPVNTVPTSQTTDEDTELDFSAGDGNRISISDVDAGSNPMQVTLTATHGTLTLNGTMGLTFSTGDGTADAIMVFAGTITSTNTALNGMVFSPTTNYNGAANLQINTNDQGYTGSGGAKSDTDTVNITVQAVNDPPVADNDAYNVNEGITLTVTAPGVLDGDTDVENDTLTATLASPPSHGTLTLNPDGSFTYVHDGTTSSDSFTYQAYDGTDYSNVATATINIQLFAPVITAITVTSDSPTYFYAPPLDVDAGGQVFFNSVFGEGGGQTITVTISFTDAHPYSLTGSPAFGDLPGFDISGPPWTLTYTIETGANSEPSRVFTVTDKAGLTDTAVITFTRDNVDPTVELTDVTNPGYDYDPDWGQSTDELDIDGSNWYNAGDFIGVTYRWYFTSTTTDDGGAGLASGAAFWDHTDGTTYDKTKDCGPDGSDFFSWYPFPTNWDGMVTVTVTITDRVGNSASDWVVFNIDNTPPEINWPSFDEHDSPYLHVPGSTVIYYSHMMGDDPQIFDVEGWARDVGVGLNRVTYPEAFNITPSPDVLKASPPPDPDWRFWSGMYAVDEDETEGDGTIEITVSDLLGNLAYQSFFHIRDLTDPEVQLTDVTDPDHDPDGNELNTAGNWYRTGGLTSGWTFTSNTSDSGAGLPLPSSTGVGTAFWDHSDGTAHDQTMDCGSGGDGTFTGVSDDGDGTVTVTVTVTDNVGNATSDMVVIQLDGTPPSVPGNFYYQDDGDSGGDGFYPLPGYYDDPVIDLEWNPSTDGGSSLPTNPYHLGTAPQPTGGSYAEDSSYNVSSSGAYTIYLTAEDNAGNISDDAVTGPVIVDTQAPQVNVDCPPGTANFSFVVDWSATFDQGLAGLRSTNAYSVSYSVDSGAWQDWIAATSAVTATFGPTSPVTVEYTHTYCFRVRAVDKAGNVAYTDGDDCTEVGPAYGPDIKKVFLPLIMVPDPNWGFELGNFTNWQHGGQLAQSVSTAMPYSGNYSAILGSPSYACNNGVPVGNAWLRRSVVIPSGVVSPTLSFWYRIYTQDKNTDLSDQYDLFAVDINGTQVWEDANTSDPFGCSTLKDLEWRQPESGDGISLVGYEGQTIQITFYVYNRPDKWYNTYVYIDDVSVQWQ